ncbi:hypothetical protein BN946_scf184999.g74 [Trametes cinnabarina]|uniref:BolA protein n=1 Tax=Pycnoporus cinnabarinus TaxID=5643 RepID=A0A060SDG2_PYCCI|nr:hypothetical protein BN946_scf184999.g74 [Trametes cinnabarina]
MPISAADLENAICAAMPVTHLEIEDTSNGCGENYSVFVVSPAFEGKNTLARHRFSECSVPPFSLVSQQRANNFPHQVNEVLKNEIAQMHAFSQKTLTPAQWEAQLARQG